LTESVTVTCIYKGHTYTPVVGEQPGSVHCVDYSRQIVRLVGSENRNKSIGMVPCIVELEYNYLSGINS